MLTTQKSLNSKIIERGIAMNNNELANFIVDKVGSIDNISNVSHCATRLRLNLKDPSKAHTEEIKANNDVISVVETGGQYQVVVGNRVADLYEEVLQLLNYEETEVSENSSENSGIKGIFTVISAIFAPLLSAFAGAGILRGLVLLATQVGLLSESSGTYQILTIAAMTVFYFLPILLAYTTARYFKANIVFSMIIGAALINPDLIAMMGDVGNGATTSFIGIPVVLMNYASTVLPIIISIWAFSYFERFLRKHIPESGHLVFIPLITFAVMIPLTLMTIGPVTVYISNWVASLINSLIELNRILVGALVGGGWNGLVSVGMHWAVNPIMVQNIAQQGFDYIIPFTFATNFAMMGSAVGVWFKAKNPGYKRYALTTALTIAFSGITEPAIYGIAIPLKRPFIAALIGGAIGGAYIGFQGVTAQAFVFGGLTTLPTFAGGQSGNLTHAVIGLAICVIVSAIGTVLLGFEEPDVLKS